MRKVTLFTVISLLSITLSLFVAQTAADASFIDAMQGLPSIVIQSDGTVIPQTNYIKQEGNHYSLTEDLAQKYFLVINCSNIVFDGRGHCINGSNMIYWNNNWHGYSSTAITLQKVSNVIIQNVRIMGFEGHNSIYVSDCYGITISRVETEDAVWIQSSHNNTVSNNVIDLWLIDSRYNIITKNEIRLTFGENSIGSLFYENNFESIDYGVHYIRESGYCPLNLWDNGSIGNYWSDSIRDYSNTTLSTDQIFVIDGENIDHYPISKPLTLDLEIFSSSTVPDFPITASVIAVLIAVSLLLVIGKRKQSISKS